jgi:hypothetical protein
MFALAEYRAWRDGRKEQPIQAMVWGIIGLVSIVLVVAAIVFGLPVIPADPGPSPT